MVMKPRRNHVLLTSALVGGAFLKLSHSANAAETVFRFDIPSEPLSAALTDVSRVASRPIIYTEDQVKGRAAPGLHGTYTASKAVTALLSGTRLQFDTNSSGALTVESVSNGSPQLQPTSYEAAAPDPQGTAATPAAASPADETAPDAALQTVVVTGTTTKRTLLNSSVAITAISAADLDQKAPRGTDDVLEMIPGIFVEGTAGPVSNNYSVRGLPGGGQEFIRLEEDGMPAIYGGLNDDEVFQNDISIDHVEALEGGSSGILTPNAAGASINFISRALNFDTGSGITKLAGTTYGDRRADFWYSAPLTTGLAFAVSGYYDSNPGTRDSSFRYDTWHTKLQLEKRFDNGASVQLTVKRWDEHDPYYADQPYAYNNGRISSVPGLDSQFGSIIGPGFGNISVPDSCPNECFRTFSEQQGIHATGGTYRIDLHAPIGDSVTVFARARYTDTDWDFNGVFAGSGTGNSGLAPALTYLTPTPDSPIASLLTMGQAAFPGTTMFGIRSLTTGQVIPATDVAALDGLNGNGLLEETVLNRQSIRMHDWGSDFGSTWDSTFGDSENSLTLGSMLYSTQQFNDQSGVSTLINDVTNQSNIYDIVAMNSAGGVLGSLSNNGLISYGDWGSGISSYDQNSQSVYLNNEFTWNKRLHIDIGMRYEHEHETATSGNSALQDIPLGVTGLAQSNPNAFNGTYSYASGHETPFNYTAGVNYTLTPQLSVYGRFERAYETQGLNPHATGLTLYEAGVTFADFGVLGTLRAFRTQFNNQSFGGGVDPANPNLNLGFFGNSDTNGVDVDATYRPDFEPLHAFSLHAQATYQDSSFNSISTGTITINNVNVSSEADAFYDGKTPGRTPNLMYTLTPAYDFPGQRGQFYVRYAYIGRIFADNGDQVVLPAYGVLSVGALYNITPNATVNVSVDNTTNALGLTEGNPRQGFTQQIVNGYFYGRGIVGPTALASLTVKF
jgi:outer membrane receptor protein involved in Fe transport